MTPAEIQTDPLAAIVQVVASLNADLDGLTDVTLEAVGAIKEALQRLETRIAALEATHSDDLR